MEGGLAKTAGRGNVTDVESGPRLQAKKDTTNEKFNGRCDGGPMVVFIPHQLSGYAQRRQRTLLNIVVTAHSAKARS